MNLKTAFHDRSFMIFLAACYLMVNLAVIFVIFDAYQSLSRDYAQLQLQNGELRVLAGLNALSADDDEASSRYERYREYLLDKYGEINPLRSTRITE